MSKKKRNKVYKGSVAAQRPVVMHVSAVKRNPAHQWWVDNKRIARPVLITVGIVIAVIIVIVGFIDIIF
ncbi:MAG: hypothetical protein WAW80_04285 [Candidatus Saccharimonadales bacterium]